MSGKGKSWKTMKNYAHLLEFSPRDNYYIKLKFRKKQVFPNLMLQDKEMVATGDDIYNAIVTCGMPTLSTFNVLNIDREQELRFKIAAFNSIFTIMMDKNCKQYPVARDDNLLWDSSEKAVLSYYAGMIMTRIITLVEPQLYMDVLVHYGLAMDLSGQSLGSIRKKEISHQIILDMGKKMIHALSDAGLSNMREMLLALKEELAGRISEGIVLLQKDITADVASYEAACDFYKKYIARKSV